jgi:hypothetical protein
MSFSDCAPASCSLAAKIGLESPRMVSAPMRDLGLRSRRLPSKGLRGPRRRLMECGVSSHSLSESSSSF